METPDKTKFTCAVCSGTFDKARSDHEAKEESIMIWGVIPEEETATICAVCFERGFEHKELLEKIKKEGDLLEWEYLNFTCLITRGHLGSLCGYVGVDKNHIFFGKHFLDKIDHGDIENIEVSVETHGAIGVLMAMFEDQEEGKIPMGMLLKAHGGITWANVFEEYNKDVWYIGFDCGHSGDLVPHFVFNPIFKNFRSMQNGIYRDMEYVKKQVEYLAEQLLKYKL